MTNEYYQKLAEQNAYWTDRGFGTTAAHAFLRNKIYTLEDLSRYTMREIAKFEHIGNVNATRIFDTACRNGLHLELDGWHDIMPSYKRVKEFHLELPDYTDSGEFVAVGDIESLLYWIETKKLRLEIDWVDVPGRTVGLKLIENEKGEN